ncbi:hypothetical protein [Pyrococcus yayanosii]|uniref:hypothetical protein n=1 Tax=Pyrococcus yayanosii TaxID=1008460 RepID=UPI0011D28155|nr:hypothetical protein [Pyrococcus yayanosii]
MTAHEKIVVIILVNYIILARVILKVLAQSYDVILTDGPGPYFSASTSVGLCTFGLSGSISYPVPGDFTNGRVTVIGKGC